MPSRTRHRFLAFTTFLAVAGLFVAGAPSTLAAPAAAPTPAPAAAPATSGVSDFGLSTISGDQFGLRSDSPAQFISSLVNWILGILGVVLVALIFYGGVLYMTAAGNEDRVKTGKRVLTFAIVGLVITMSAFIIATFVVRALTNSSAGTVNTSRTGSTIYGNGYAPQGYTTNNRRPSTNPNNETWCEPPSGFYCDYGLGGAVPINDITRRGGVYSFEERSSFGSSTLPEKTDTLLFPLSGDKPANQ